MLVDGSTKFGSSVGTKGTQENSGTDGVVFRVVGMEVLGGVG